MSTPGNLSEQILAVPGGAGSVRSAGETFQADPYTGTGKYSVPIQLEAGPAGLQPALGLSYSTHGGNGAAGQGWSLGLASVGRRTDKGLPSFDDDDDTFTLQGDELVPVGDGAYRQRIESRFARIRHVRRGGDFWVVTEKDGTRTFYGETPESRVSDGAGRIATWNVTRKQDVHGNEVVYSYVRDVGTREVRLVRVSWAGCFRAELDWEVRPDPIRSSRMGFRTEERHRLTAIRVEVVRGDTSAWHTYRRYDLGYTTSRWTGRSLLASVTVTGIDETGTEAQLPSVSMTYVDPAPAARRWHQIAGDVPGQSLQSRDVTLVHQSGGGLPDVLETRESGHYLRTNLGDGVLGPARQVTSPAWVALSDQGTFLSDMSGDGWADLVVQGGARVFKRAVGGGFSEAYPATARPSVDLTDPQVKLSDLTGNGIPDALRAGASGWLFFENLGDGQWAPPVRVLRPPPVRFDDPRVHLVDIDGDGLADLVNVGEDGIDVWPGMGRGTFGPRYRLANTPKIEARLDPAAVRWMDLTGSGQADLLYVKSGAVWVCTNKAGTALGAPVQVADIRQGSKGHIEPVDLLGTSAQGLLFSEPGSWRFLEIFPSGAPDLLERIDNGMGATTTLEYGSSGAHWARDQRAGRPWKTAMPSAQRVVDRVTTTDGVTGVKLQVAYRYHHGVYDGVEREFRGFAAVEQLDREAERGDPQPLSQVRTARWYHTGADVDLANEWTPHRKGIVRDEVPAVPWARRSLRGQVRREEVFALDGNPLPYQITQTSYRVFAVGARRNPQRSSFCPLPVHQRLVHLERQRDDRVVDTTTTYDLHTGRGFGLPVEVREKAYGRLGSFATAHEQQQTEALERITRTTYVSLVTPEVYIVGKPSLEERYAVDGASEVLLDRVRTFYDGDDYEGLGYPGSGTTAGLTRGLVSSRLQLALTSSLMTSTYPTGAGHSAAKSARGNYVVDTDDYIAAERYAYAANGQVVGQRDANGNTTTITYDGTWGLFPVSSEDAAGHPTTFIRGTLPHQLAATVDANGNRIGFTYDATGLPASKSLQGKQDGMGVWSGDPPTHPTEVYEYDFDALPIHVTVKQRQVREGATFDVHRYLDGLGQVVQERHMAEPDPASPSTPRFRVTGWQIRNHKGLVVKAFQPTFSGSSAYSAGDEDTAFIETQYDPLGRPIRVTYPDGTFESTTYHPWTQEVRDRNDNAGHLTGADPRYGAFLDRFADHLDTPTVKYVDALGREIAVSEDNGEQGDLRQAIRTTTYQIPAGEFTGTSYDLTLSHPLSADYFVMITGTQDASPARADNVGVRVTQDPFGTGDLSASSGANVLRLQRAASGGGDWQGTITVVESLGDAEGAGFRLVDVTAIAASGTTTHPQNVQVSANATWDDLGRVVLYGGLRGGGATTASADGTQHTSLFGKLTPSGTDTIDLDRHGGGVNLQAAVFTVFVVQWGAEHHIERVTVSGNAGGAGVDATAEYDTASLSASVTRANTWLWMSGYVENNGSGDSFAAQVLALGDGVTQSSSESAVAVGGHHGVQRSILVTVHAHPSLAVDWRFVSLGNGTATSVAHTVDDATIPEDDVYDEASTVTSTEGPRLAVQTNTHATTTAQLQRTYFGARHTDSDTVTVTRTDGTGAWAAWVQSVDFAGVTFQPRRRHVTRSVLDLRDQVVEVWDARELADATWKFTYDYAGRRIQTEHTTGTGARWALADAAGNPIWSRDARGIEVDRTFDVLNRPLAEATDDGSSVKLRRGWRYLTYDDQDPDHATFQAKNLYGQVEEARDADGVRFFEYDHRGLPVKASHRFWDRAWKSGTDPMWALGAAWDLAVPATARDSVASWLTLSGLTDTTTVQITTTYDSAGRPTQVDYPESMSLRSTYDEAGHLATLQLRRTSAGGFQDVVADLTYNARGQVTGWVHGNGVETTREYDEDLERLMRLFTELPGSPDVYFQDLAYAYDPAGNPVKLTDNVDDGGFAHNQIIPNTREYHYDPRYRLVRAKGKKHTSVTAKSTNPLVSSPDINDYEPYDYRYVYDEVGNFYKNHEYSRGQLHYKDDLPDLFNGDGREAIDGARAAGNYRYDENGNTTHTPRQQELAYTHDNQVRFVDMGGGTEVQYLRHADQRVVRFSRASSQHSLGIYLGPWEYHDKDGVYTKAVLHAEANGRHAQAEVVLSGTDSTSEEIWYVHGDHLGSGHVITKSDGSLLTQEEYFPYGRASDRRDARNRYRFIGVERDEHTGLCMTGPRTYDPVSGRFLQTDPAPKHAASSHGYSGGNPTLLLDSSGYSEKKGFLGLFGGRQKSAGQAVESRAPTTDQLTVLKTGIEGVQRVVEDPTIRPLFGEQDLAGLEGALQLAEMGLDTLTVADELAGGAARGTTTDGLITLSSSAFQQPDSPVPTYLHESLHAARKSEKTVTDSLTQGQEALRAIELEYPEERVEYIASQLLQFAEGKIDSDQLRVSLSSNAIHDAAWSGLAPYTTRLARLGMSGLNLTEAGSRAFVASIEQEARSAFVEQRKMRVEYLRGL